MAHPNRHQNNLLHTFFGIVVVKNFKHFLPNFRYASSKINYVFPSGNFMPATKPEKTFLHPGFWYKLEFK